MARFFKILPAEETAARAKALIVQSEGYISQDELPTLRALAMPTLDRLHERLQRFLLHTPLSYQELADLLNEAFVTGWSCRGAVDQVLDEAGGETPPEA